MAKQTELKNIAHGEQNIYKVSSKRLPSDTELERKRRTEYKQSANRVERARFTARVIQKGELVKNPISWSLSNSNLRQDVSLPVVRAVIVEIPTGPSPDMELKTINNTTVNPATTSYVSSFDFIGVNQDLPLPDIGDDIWVDFENRKTLSGPIYLGMKTAALSKPASAAPTTASTAGKTAGTGLSTTATAPAGGSPVPGTAKVTSPMGPRTPPFPGASAMHEGIDVGVPVGTPIRALFTGLVVKVGSLGSAGGYIISILTTSPVSSLAKETDRPIDYVGRRNRAQELAGIRPSSAGVRSVFDFAPSQGDGIQRYRVVSSVKAFYVSYLHLSKISPAVGEYVIAETVIGESGAGPGGAHLHLEVSTNGTWDGNNYVGSKREATNEEASAVVGMPVSR